MALIRFRRGSAASWTSANPILASGEPGYETDTKKLKVGDGSAHWNTLPYILNQDGVAALITAAIDELDIPTGYIILDVDETVPDGTPAGTLILRNQV